jgi:putative tryptophan/tyrosine transport system substrate-binding protein
MANVRQEGMMRRRDFIAGLAACAPFSLAARAQQQPAMPVIGHLALGSPNKPLIAAMHQGLTEGGYVEGQNVAVEYRFANGQRDRLPALATDLVQRGVAVIFTEGGTPAALAAKQATTTIPIVFLGGGDPVQDGLVSSMNRPEANLTGLTFSSAALGPKKLEILRELVPQSGEFGVLMNRTPSGEAEADNVAAAAKAVKQEVHIIGANSIDDIERAFETFAGEKVAAVLVTTGAFFGTNTQRIVALAARYSLPAIYDRREFTAVGGLISYGTQFDEIFRQAGIYVARILKGAKPGDLPVLEPTKFELAINLKTAKTLGIKVPQTLLVAADKVIE